MIDKSTLCYTCKNLVYRYTFSGNYHNLIHVCESSAVEPEWFKLLIDPTKNDGLGCAEYVEKEGRVNK